MASSPQQDGEGVLRYALKCNGAPVADDVPVHSITIQRDLNAIPWAKVVIFDGDMPHGTSPLSDGATFLPGATVEISGGYGDQEETLFEGVILRHSLTIATDNQARLTIECRDKAAAMTLRRHNANFAAKTDSAIMQTLIESHGLSASVAATSPVHDELVQYYCTDWDFLVARADFNGLLVAVVDGKVAVTAPDTAAEPDLRVTWGVDLLSFHADIDARTQLGAAKAVSWDFKTQDIVESESVAPPTLNRQGNLTGQTLAGVMGQEVLCLQTQAPQQKESLTAWAKAVQLKAGLARIRGRMSFQGSAKARLGGLIDLAGVGERFNGKVFVSSLRHELAAGAWTTEVEFGLAPTWHVERPDVMAPINGGVSPGVLGLQVGVVTKLDGDPAGESRIQVKVPVLHASDEGIWARLVQAHASSGFGAFFVPEVGDEVVLGYFNGDPTHPVVLGSLYSSARKPADLLAAENDIKSLVTRCKHRIEFDDKNKAVTITTPGGNKVRLDDTAKSILLEDENGNKATLSSSGIALDSPQDIKLAAKGAITLDAAAGVTVTSKADVKVDGVNVACQAQVAFSANGSASAEVSASGQTVIKGAMVLIN